MNRGVENGGHMFWRSKPPKQPEPPKFERLPENTPEQKLSRALSQYQTDYYKNLTAATNEDADRAKQLVSDALTFVNDSRLSYSLCRSVLGHVKYWPSWAKREDFGEWCREPFKYVSGSNESLRDVVVTFLYSDRPYTIRFADHGIPSFADDMTALGKIELNAGDKSVLGLDIYEDRSKEYSHWTPLNLFAFQPGDWMKDLVEMGAHVDAEFKRRMDNLQNKYALDRAARIHLPEGEG